MLGRGLQLSAWLEVCLDICRRIQATESCSAAYEFCEINASYLLYYNDSAYHAATQINHCIFNSTGLLVLLHYYCFPVHPFQLSCSFWFLFLPASSTSPLCSSLPNSSPRLILAFGCWLHPCALSVFDSTSITVAGSIFDMPLITDTAGVGEDGPRLATPPAKF